MFKGWRTLLFNVLAAIIPMLDVLVIIGAMPETAAIIPPEWYPYYALAIALANKLLRWLTTTPIGKKETEHEKTS